MSLGPFYGSAKHRSLKTYQYTVVDHRLPFIVTFTNKQTNKSTRRQTQALFQNERDLSVRQRAVDLLYAMCDREQAEDIVAELLSYLEKADYSIREELVGNY